ncbi:YezD family protein [Methylophaga lonarensis]|uniref:YezD family protein n=1 Tax=Methylophaga lonarensis TaxID=999151 RepID=UPI003D29523E
MNKFRAAETDDSSSTENLLAEISSLLKDLQFGSLEIIVHEGKVVQLERHEKFRPNTASGKKVG